ncbi:MAG: hypothetical protein KIS77_07265 [Saprospiraceae bacterium]|nr:hypothetical protein [Saprospiraceae bacterium]
MIFKQRSISENIVFIAALGLLAGIVLSWPLWNVAARCCFPTLPLWGGSPQAPHLSHWSESAWVAGLALLLIGPFVFSGKKILPGLLAVWLAWLCLLDLNRLQPWVWMYLLIFAAAIWEKKDDEASNTNLMRWLLAGIYFWSGINKLTPYFANDTFAWFCETFGLTRSLGQYPIFGYALGLLEASFAAGLLWHKTRPYFRWLVLGFHCLVVVFLLKQNWNWVVIPWNLAMASMVWVLSSTAPVSGTTANVSRRFLPIPHSLREAPKAAWLILLLVWLAPALGLFRCWPHTLSWQLYTNTQPEATFFAESGKVNATAESFWVWEKYAYDDGTKLFFDDWANDELKVPMFATRHTFRQLGRYLCRCASEPEQASLFILHVRPWHPSAEKMEEIPCRQLNPN